MTAASTAYPVQELEHPAEEHLAAVRSFVQTHLSTLRRRTGESYAEHAAEVADVLREVSTDPTLLAAALAHDILMHPDGERLLNDSPLTPDEKALAEGMHQLRRLHIDASTKDLDTVITAFTSDSRLLLLRMAHRLRDVRHLDRFGKRLQKEIARETLHMYTAIAGRLGFHRWRYEMEDACFRVAQAKQASVIEAEFRRMADLDRVCLDQAMTFLRKHFDEAGITALLTHRVKGLYSTYRKMVVKRRAFHELTDRLALRIIVPTLDDCYLALGVVHRCMHCIPGKLKDYIGAPKENGYRSIHTVVWPLAGVTEQPIEIQIRTAEMDRQCEFGVTSHAEYKRMRYALEESHAKVNLLRNLEILRAEARSPHQFERALRSYFDESHMAVFDADDNLYHIRKPATARTFLKMAYPERWKEMRDIRINGRRRTPDTPLHDGDCVEAK